MKEERNIGIGNLQKLVEVTTIFRQISLEEFLRDKEKWITSDNEVDFLWLRVSVKIFYAHRHRRDAERILFSCPRLNYLRGDFFCFTLKNMFIDNGDKESFREKDSLTILTLRFFALGKALGFWSIIPPLTLHIFGEGEYAYREAVNGLAIANRRVDQRGMGGRIPPIVKPS